MRQEAMLDEWRDLYAVVTRIKALQPWEHLWDMDLIALSDGEETAYISVLGRNGECFGLSVYEGLEGLNDFMLMTLQEKMNLAPTYVMYSQNSLTCYWGNREELSKEQRNIIKELGYSYRGKNQWLYFMSYAEGYYPYNLDREEVIRMTRYMTLLEEALIAYYKFSENEKVPFEEEKLFAYSIDSTGAKHWGIEEVPFTSYQYLNLIIEDEELLEELNQVNKTNIILEADTSYLGVCVNDPQYIRPANPALCLIADSIQECIIKADMVQPEEDAFVALAENVIGFILTYGAPKEIRVSNILVEAVLEQICQVTKTKLRRVKKLPILTDFMENAKQFM